MDGDAWVETTSCAALVAATSALVEVEEVRLWNALMEERSR